MESNSDRLVERRRSLHQILGGGFVADVILWRRKEVTVGLLMGTVATFIMFQRSGHTLLSFLSKVALLLTSILFFWAKAATILRRQLPPLPDMAISEERMNAVAASLRSRLNSLLTIARDVALGKETHLFLVIASSLWIVSVVGSLMDFVTLGYACMVVGLTVPALYEKYERNIERSISSTWMGLQRGYERLEAAYANIFKRRILQKRKSH